MKELTDEQIYKVWYPIVDIGTVAFCLPFARAAIAADRALNAEDHDPLEPKRLESIADPTLRAVCETYTNTPGGHFMRLQAIAKLVPAPADRDVMRQAQPGILDVIDDFEADYNGFHLEPEHMAEWFKKLRAAAPTPPAEQSGHDPAGPRDARFVCDLCDEDSVIVYKRSEFTKNWTTFNVRKECANLAEERLKSPSLAELRAKVEALPKYATDKGWMVGRSDVLALLGEKE